MQRQAENLAVVSKESGLEIEHLDLTNEHEFSAIEKQLLDWASAHTDNDITLNLTGGTKLMALAAQSVAKAADWKILYADIDTDKVTWLHENNKEPHSLNEQLRLNHYLRSYGFDLKRQTPPQSTRQQQLLMDTLVRQIGSLERPLSQLNWLTQEAETRRQLHVAMTPEQQDSRGLEALLRHFSDAEALAIKSNTLHFRDEAARNFVKGGWLESHVFQTLHSLPNIRDKAANLEVIDKSGAKNELDVIFMANNRLFVIECKTARMDKPEAPKANDALFKLAENCRRVGGIGTRGMLISYRALREPEKKLANALRIELVCGADIVHLQERLKTWVKPTP
jgi:hypothetical protein